MNYQATIKNIFKDASRVPEGASIDTAYTFTDTYSFDASMYDDEAARSFIARDLRLVAGGGYEPVVDHYTVDIKRVA